MLEVTRRHAAAARSFWTQRSAADLACNTQLERRCRRVSTCSLPSRSRTPSRVFNDRVSPPSGPFFKLRSRTMSDELLDALPDDVRPSSTQYSPYRFQTTCWLKMQSVPIRYSSTVELKIGSTKRNYTETVQFKTRLVPRRYGETTIALVGPAPGHFISSLEIQCVVPAPSIRLHHEDSHSDA